MSNLPQPPTTLFGRDRDLTVVRRLLDSARWVTLTGIGGIGKSRLALAVGHALAGSGVVVRVEAVGIHDVTALMLAIGDALDVSLDEDSDVVAALGRATRSLGPRVVILDNLEHLAAGEVGAWLERWLGFAANVRLLVTSRVVLAAPAEHVHAVEPLDTSIDGPAVALLSERAGRVVPGWSGTREELAKIAAQLDGLPLAIELAATRARVLSATEMNEVLATRGELGSIESAIRTSWEALAPTARADLVGLAVVEGRFGLQRAALLLGRSLPEAFDAIEVLLRVSLIATEHERGATHHRVLETVRRFALRHGDAQVAAAARRRFVDDLLERAAPLTSDFFFVPGVTVGRRIDADREHYLELAQRAATTNDVVVLEQGLRAAHALFTAASLTGMSRALVRPLVKLLSHPLIEQTDAPVRMRWAMMAITSRAGDDVELAALVAALRRWLEAAPDARAEVYVTYLGAVIAMRERDATRALTLHERAMAQASAVGDDIGWARAALGAVMARRALGELELGQARATLSRCEAIAKARDLPRLQAMVLHALAEVLVELGEPEAVPAVVERAAASGRLAGLAGQEAFGLRERARAAGELGRWDEAARDFAAAVEAFAAADARRERLETRLDHAIIELGRGHYDRVAELLAEPVSAEQPFSRALADAIAHARRVLLGQPSALAPFTPGSVIDDHVIAAYAAIGGPLMPQTASALAARAPKSWRIRQVLALTEAVVVLRGDGRSVCAIDLDGSAFRCGPAWVELRATPLVMVLLDVLVEAHFAERGRVVDKETMFKRAWPDERIGSEALSNRLHVVVSRLRRAGLEDLVEAQEGGYRIHPDARLVRLSRAAFPGVAPIVASRGRGRPKKTV